MAIMIRKRQKEFSGTMKIALVILGIIGSALFWSTDGDPLSTLSDYESLLVSSAAVGGTGSSGTTTTTIRGTRGGAEEEWPGIPQDELPSKLVRLNGERTPFANAREFLLEHLDEFLEVYKNRPDQTNVCGIRINHSLALFMAVKRLQPTTVIESGVNSGQSTYFIRKALTSPTGTKIISIDPEEKPICSQPVRWIDTTNNEYLTGKTFIDFDDVNWKERIDHGELDPSNTLVFIDDHLGNFLRLPTCIQYGFKHLIHEDNYKLGEGATRQDKLWTFKQFFAKGPHVDADTEWLFHNLKSYHEMPPIFPPSLGEGTTSVKKQAGGILHPTDDLTHIEPPMLDPKHSKQDELIFQRFASELQLDPTLKDWESYQEFLAYNFISYMEIVPLSPTVKTKWNLK